MQNLHYTYDPAGNITHIRDDAQQTIFFSNQRVEPSAEYTYDAIYRLIEATGREHLGQIGGVADSARRTTTTAHASALLHPGDGNAMGRYLERYVYDAVGNFLRCSIAARSGASRLDAHLRLQRDQPARARQAEQPAEQHHGRTATTDLPIAGDQLRRARQHAADAAPAVDAVGLPGPAAWPRQATSSPDDVGARRRTYYVYDAAGQRVRKVTEPATAAGLKDERIYLGGFEIYREYAGDSAGLGARDAARHGRQAAHRAGGDAHARATTERADSSSSATSSATTSARPAWSWTTRRRSSPTRSTTPTAARPIRRCAARPRRRSATGTRARSAMRRAGSAITVFVSSLLCILDRKMG